MIVKIAKKLLEFWSHTGEKLFKCKYCDKRFVSSSRLISHAKIHTGDKPYKCEYCRRYFAEKDNLTHHVRTHSTEKPFNCESSGKTRISIRIQ